MPMLDKDIAGCSSDVRAAHTRFKQFGENILINGPDSESYINLMIEHNKELIDLTVEILYMKEMWAVASH